MVQLFSTGKAVVLKTAINALHSVRYKWHIIGVQLEVPTHELKDIEKKPSDSLDKLSDILVYWLTHDPSASWGHLVDALKASSVDENRLAEEIKEKYCSQDEQCSCNDSIQAKCHQGTNVFVFFLHWQ